MGGFWAGEWCLKPLSRVGCEEACVCVCVTSQSGQALPASFLFIDPVRQGLLLSSFYR